MLDLAVLASLVVPAPTPAPTTTPAFTSANALATLLTVESLLFTVLNVAITASLPSPAGTRVIPNPKLAAIGVASLITIAGIGAGAAWLDLFKGWPDVPIGIVPSTAIVLALVAQPVLTWLIVKSMPSG